MKKIYIVLTHTGTTLSKIIKDHRKCKSNRNLVLKSFSSQLEKLFKIETFSNRSKKLFSVV